MSEFLTPHNIEPDVEQETDESLVSQYVGGPAHVHTTESSRWNYVEGELTLEEQVVYLRDQVFRDDPEIGNRFLALGEHTSNPGAPERLGVDDPICQSLLAQDRQVESLKEATPFKVFSGVEANILPDGRVDLPDEVLSQLDLVVASRHALPHDVEKTPSEIVRTLTTPMTNENVDVIGHPNRYTNDVEGVDWPGIFEAARQTNTAIEVNASTFPILKTEADHQHVDQPKDWWRDWLTMLATSGAPVFFGVDFHQFRPLQGGEQPTSERLKTGPGTIMLLRLSRIAKMLQEVGITPERVVNSRADKLEQWLNMPKAKRADLYNNWQAK